MPRLGHVDNYYVFIYRVRAGLRAVLMTEERFVEAIQAPGHALTEVDDPNRGNCFNVAYPKEWSEADAHYLINTQVKRWPIFENGVEIREPEEGSAWPEVVTTDSLPF